MYMQDLWASLARRWALVVVCLLATAGLTYYVSQRVPPTFESRADVVLVPPKSVEDPTINRYLSLGGLRQAVDVLTRSLSAERTKEEVQGIAPRGTFEAAADATTSAPILIVTATAKTSADAQKVLEAVLGQIPVTLGELQESVDIASADRITPQVVSQDDVPNAVNKKQIRAVGAAAAFLLLMSAMLVGIVDNRLLVRKGIRTIEHREVRPEVTGRGTSTIGSRHGPSRPGAETRKQDVVFTQIRR